MPDSVKEGDAKTLRWNLGRDLTGVTEARVIIAVQPGVAPAVDRAGVIESPTANGIVHLALTTDDYGTGKLQPGVYYVEVETSPGPLTHPDDGYETLTVISDL